MERLHESKIIHIDVSGAGRATAAIQADFCANPDTFSRGKSLGDGYEIPVGFEAEHAKSAVFDGHSQFDRIGHIVLRKFLDTVHSQYDSIMGVSFFERERGERFSAHGQTGFFADLFRTEFQRCFDGESARRKFLQQQVRQLSKIIPRRRLAKIVLANPVGQ